MKRREGLLSIVVPAFNERACLPELVARVERALAPSARRYEVIVVDDRSTDGTFDVVRELAARDGRIRGARLSKNSGSQNALWCGIGRARGDAVVMLDADLQHPPENLPRMLEAWEGGFDVVNMLRRDPQQLGFVRGVPTRVFYALFAGMSDVPLSRNSTDFRLLDRRCVDALLGMPEQVRFIRGMVSHVGFEQTEIVFDAPARFAGTSGYTMSKLLAVATDALFAFAPRVLIVPLYTGALTLAATIALTVAASRGPTLPGGLMITLAILATGLLWSLLFVFLGVLGAYLSRLAAEVKGRPSHFVDEVVGFEAEGGPDPTRSA